MASEHTPEPRQTEPQGAPAEGTHGRGTSDNRGLFYWYWWRRGSLPPALLMLTPPGALVESDPSTVLHPRVRDQHLQFLDPIITPLLQDERLTFDELRAAIESRRQRDDVDPDRRFDSDRRFDPVDGDLLWRWLMSAERRRVVVPHDGAGPHLCGWDLTAKGVMRTGPVAAFSPIARFIGVGSVLVALGNVTTLVPISDNVAVTVIVCVIALGFLILIVFLWLANRFSIGMAKDVREREHEIQRALTNQSEVVPWWPSGRLAGADLVRFDHLTPRR